MAGCIGLRFRRPRFSSGSLGGQAGRSWHPVRFSHGASVAVKEALRSLSPPVLARDRGAICAKIQCFLSSSSMKVDYLPGSTVCEFLKLRFFFKIAAVEIIFSQINQCVDSICHFWCLEASEESPPPMLAVRTQRTRATLPGATKDKDHETSRPVYRQTLTV